MTEFQFNIRSYLKALYIALLHPVYYSQIIAQYKSLKNALLFFITNISLGLMIYISEKVIYAHNLALIFPSISETLFWIPVSCFVLFIVVLSLHILAKIGGGKGKFSESLNVACFASLPLLFIGFSYVYLFSWVWCSVLLILAFRKVHSIRSSKAVLTIALPFIIMILLLIMLGIINPVRMFSGMSNLA